MKIKMRFTSLSLKLISLIILHSSYFYKKGEEDQPTFTASDYLKEYQVVDQWNKSITYTKEVSEFKRELTKVVSQLYPC